MASAHYAAMAGYRRHTSDQGQDLGMPTAYTGESNMGILPIPVKRHFVAVPGSSQTSHMNGDSPLRIRVSSDKLPCDAIPRTNASGTSPVNADSKASCSPIPMLQVQISSAMHRARHGPCPPHFSRSAGIPCRGCRKPRRRLPRLVGTLILPFACHVSPSISCLSYSHVGLRGPGSYTQY